MPRPPRPGSRLHVPALVALVATGLAACNGSAPPGAPAATVPAGLSILEVQATEVPAERILDGTVEAVDQAAIAAQTAGRVAELRFDVNEVFPAGAVLVRLRGTEQRAGLAQAEAASREATARATEAEARYGRIAGMYERKVVAKAQLDQAAAERDAAVARVTAARAAVQGAREGVDYTEIKAPYAGVVTARPVRVGESVAPGTPLVSIAALGRLRVAVDIPQSLVADVRKAGRAAIYAGDRRLESTALTVFPEADAATNTFRTRVEVPAGAPELSPGMFVKVGFVTATRPGLVVPRSAIITRSEVTAVYVVATGGQLSLRQVRLGRPTAGGLEVLAGLSPGDRVAVDAMAAMNALGTTTTRD